MAVNNWNEQGYVNPNLQQISNNNVGTPRTGSIPLPSTTVTTFYRTATVLNATTGQTENETALIIN